MATNGSWVIAKRKGSHRIRKQPTFVAGKILLDMPQWQGVPIYIRTGKRLTRKSTQITLTFKPVTASPLFSQAEAVAARIA